MRAGVTALRERVVSGGKNAVKVCLATLHEEELAWRKERDMLPPRWPNGVPDQPADWMQAMHRTALQNLSWATLRRAMIRCSELGATVLARTGEEDIDKAYNDVEDSLIERFNAALDRREADLKLLHEKAEAAQTALLRTPEDFRAWTAGLAPTCTVDSQPARYPARVVWFYARRPGLELEYSFTYEAKEET